MAGLRLAQELVSLKLKQAENQNIDPHDKSLAALRRTGQYIVILYQRALRTRLRDMYSTFLTQMIGAGSVRVGYAEADKDKPILVLNPKSVATRQEIEEAVLESKFWSKEAEKKLGDTSRNNNTVAPTKSDGSPALKFYYFFLGDILQTMMKSAGIREDISLILGNFEDINGNVRSIYNIPISMETFAKFFFEKVVTTQKKVYPFRLFMNDFLKFVAKMMNQNPQASERISFDFTTIYSTGRNIACSNNSTLSKEDVDKIRIGAMDPLYKKNVK